MGSIVISHAWGPAKASTAAMSAWIESNRDKRPQAQSEQCLQAGWFICASIGGGDKEVSERKGGP